MFYSSIKLPKTSMIHGRTRVKQGVSYFQKILQKAAMATRDEDSYCSCHGHRGCRLLLYHFVPLDVLSGWFVYSIKSA